MAQPDDIILSARGLTKEFAGFVAVDGVDLDVRRGTIHALIGPNGAGKTTCFNLLTKFLTPTRGSIIFSGRDITAMQSAQVGTIGLARSFQISAVFPGMSALENVRIALQRKRGESFDFWRSRKALNALNAEAEGLLDMVGLSEMADKPAGDLPYGRKRALELATTLALKPDMLLLDEPMAGMTQADIGVISGLIRLLAREHTVLMVEHNLNVIADLSDAITVLARGKVLVQGDYETVSRDERVIEAYIGAAHE